MALLLFPPSAAAGDTLDARSGAAGADRPRRRDRAGRSLLLGEEGGGNGSPRGGARAHWGQEVARVRQTRRRRAARGAAVLAGGLLLGACGTAGTDPAGTGSAPVEPVQVTAGEGWRLLGEGLTGEPYRTGVATTDDQLDALWRSAGLDGEPPAVDWEREVAVWFGAVYGTGCPVRLDGVVVVEDLLHAELTLPGEPAACPDDANPHAFVVAVARDVLPD